MKLSLMLVGRSGSGKTAVMETLIGSEVKNARDVQSTSRFESEIQAMETFGFFSGDTDLQKCTNDLANCVTSFSGIDVIGLVIRLGRFTPEEKNMLEIVRDTLGETAFSFTIVIFTHLDNLLYDDVPLSEFLEESPQELQDLLRLCGGRYVGFDNTGSATDKEGYARSFFGTMQALRERNKSAMYTNEILDQARNEKFVKEEEKKKIEEENFLLLKERMKRDIRTEVEGKVREELNDKRYASDIVTRRCDYHHVEDIQFTKDGGRRKLEETEDHGKGQLEVGRYVKDQGIRKLEEIEDHGKGQLEIGRFVRDQGIRKLEETEDHGKGQLEIGRFVKDQGRRKQEETEDRGKGQLEVGRFIKDQGRRKLEETEDHGKGQLEVGRFVKDQGIRQLEETEDRGQGKRQLNDKQYVDDNKKNIDGTEYSATPGYANVNEKSKPRGRKPKIKPKPDHLKRKGKKQKEKGTDSKEDLEETSSSHNSTPRRLSFVERMVQLWNSLTGQ